MRRATPRVKNRSDRTGDGQNAYLPSERSKERLQLADEDFSYFFLFITLCDLSLSTGEL